MGVLIFALVFAAVFCGILWRRPDARAAVSGAWQEGKAQAVAEFREGYQFAQHRLRAGEPSWKNPRRWISWGLAGAYGGCMTIAAANRIRARAYDGAKERYAEWKAAQPVEAEVVAEVVEDEPVGPQEGDGEQPVTDLIECPRCGTTRRVTIPGDEATVTVLCEKCGHKLHCYIAPNDVPDDWDKPQPDPAEGPQPNQEEPEVQTEAAGLTSYANAHTELATELQTRMAGIESLAASMTGTLSEHHELIGNSAVMQDLLNQAAAIANQTAARALEVANN